jgi:hypothetical protein
MEEAEIVREFQEKARAETHRQDLQEVLEVKFGRRAAKAFAPALNAINNSRRLAALYRLALRCTSLEQFQDRLPKSKRRAQRRDES